MFADELNVNKGQKKRDAARRSRLNAAAARKKKQDYIDKVEAERRAAEQKVAEDKRAGDADKDKQPTLPPVEGAESPPRSVGVDAGVASSSAAARSAPSPPHPPLSPLAPVPPTSLPSSTSKEQMMASTKTLRSSRAHNRMLIKGVTSLQSHFRRRYALASAVDKIRKDYDGKIAVLLKVATAQKNKTGVIYVPPPATVGGLVGAMLFFTDKGQDVRDGQRVAIMAGHVITPGMKGEDVHLHPLLNWVSDGKLARFVALCLSHISCRQVDPFVQGNLSRFLALLVNPPPDLKLLKEAYYLTKYARSIVAAGSNPKTNIFAVLRAQLFGTLQSYSPSCKVGDGARARETSTLLHLAIDTCWYEGQDESTRAWLGYVFVKEVMTVPLLNKRVGDEDFLMLKRMLPDLCRSLKGTREMHGGCAYKQLMPEYSLVDIPVPPTLALFGNIVSLIRAGNDGGENYQDGICRWIVPVMTGLLEEVPIGAFGTKSSVEWVKVGTSNKAIVVPEAVIEQAKGFTMDFVVRRIWGSVLKGARDEAVERQVEGELMKKGKEDVKMEKWDGGEGMTAKEMAAKDAKPER
jgi:hypothetical protein